MAFGTGGFLDRLRSLGRALLELLQAEIEALGSDLRLSAATLRTGVVLLAIAAFFGFWTVGALAYALVEVLSLWLPRWGAVLAGVGLFALLTLIFALAGKSKLKKLESPAKTVAKHVESHSQWVQQNLLSEKEPRQE